MFHHGNISPRDGCLLPLNGGGGLGGDVVDHAVDGPDLICDAVGAPLQEVRLEGVPVGRHAVCGSDCPSGCNQADSHKRL